MQIEVVCAMKVGEPPMRVRAERYGEFAIHRTIGFGGRFVDDGYTLTHSRSGFAVITHTTRAKAFRLARRLSVRRLNWRFTAPERMPKRTHAIAKPLVVEMRGW